MLQACTENWRIDGLLKNKDPQFRCKYCQAEMKKLATKYQCDVCKKAIKKEKVDNVVKVRTCKHYISIEWYVYNNFFNYILALRNLT